MKIPVTLVAVVFLLLMASATHAQRTSSAGTDFYFGLLPIGNEAQYEDIYGRGNYQLLITGFDSATVRGSYFDDLGRETEAWTVTLDPNSGATVPLNGGQLFATATGLPQWKAFHVTSSRPVSLQLLSEGEDNGELSLVLPTAGLGTRYVAASYPTSPGDTTNFSTRYWNSLLGRSMMLVVAPYDSTLVTYTPSCKTSTALGAGVPRTLLLRRGQVALIAADTENSEDISGTMVTANKLIAVFAGNNDANLPDLSTLSLSHPADNLRNPVLEQMIPVTSWDSTGYYSIPFFTPNLSHVTTPDGAGDLYRAFSLADGAATLATSSGVLSSSGLPSGTTTGAPNAAGSYGLEWQHVTDAVTLASSGAGAGGVCSLVQYDYFSGNDQPRGMHTYTVPVSMTIVPKSHWLKAYSWLTPANSDYRQGQYANIIAPRTALQRIHLARGGQTYPISSLADFSLPGSPELAGVTIALDAGAYLATCDTPFVIYTYGRTEDALKEAFGYAAPCGMSLTLDDYSAPTLSVDTLCSSFVVHVHDTRSGLYRMRDLRIYTDSSEAAKQGLSFSFNVLPPSPSPNLQDSDITFTVAAADPTKPGRGLVYLIDGLGNRYTIDLRYSRLAAVVVPRSVAMRALQDLDTCQTIAIWNPNDDKAIEVSAATLETGTSFTLDLHGLQLPFTIAPHDTIRITLCGVAHDHDTIHADTLHLITGCDLAVPLSITGLLARVNWDRDNETDSLLCGTPDTIRVWLQNNSSTHAQEVITRVYLTGLDASEFAIVGNEYNYPTLTNFPLDYGQRMWIDVAFTPDMARPPATLWQDRTAQLVAEDMLRSDPTIQLIARVTHADLVITDPSVDLGTLPVQGSASTTVEVTNDGTAAARISRIDISDPDARIAGLAIGDWVMPGQVVKPTVTVTPSSAVTKTITISIWGDGLCTPPVQLLVSVQGTDTKHSVQNSITIAGFGESFTCGHSTAPLTIWNFGPDTMRLISAWIGGDTLHPDSLLFSMDSADQANSHGARIAADSGVHFTIHYDPTSEGTHSALLRIEWDSLGTRVITTIPLTAHSTMLRTTLAASNGAVDTSYSCTSASLLFLPIYLSTSLPQSAHVERLQVLCSFDRDLFNYLGCLADTAYTIVDSVVAVNGSSTSLTLGLRSISAVTNAGKLVTLRLQSMVSLPTSSAVNMELLSCIAENGDTLCDLITAKQANITVSSQCGDDLLRTLLADRPIVVCAIAQTPAAIQVGLSCAHACEIDISLSDELGRQALATRQSSPKGASTIHLDTSRLPNGVYTMALRSGGSTILRRIAVVR